MYEEDKTSKDFEEWADEECDKDNALVDDFMKQGHTQHCASRLVWGDGVCECELWGTPEEQNSI